MAPIHSVASPSTIDRVRKVLQLDSFGSSADLFETLYCLHNVLQPPILIPMHEEIDDGRARKVDRHVLGLGLSFEM